MCRRPGLTRVEALIFLLLFALIAGLLLGVIGHVREAATTRSCENNLRQLGLTVQNYTTHNRRLPPLTDQGHGAPTGAGLPSVFANLVPYIEASSAYYNPGRSPAADYHAPSSVVFTYQNKDGTTFTEGGGMVNRLWRVFIDPGDATADQLRDVPMTLPDGTTGHYAAGSYAVNGLAPWGVRGGFPKMFPAGTEHTILIAERPQVCQSASGEVVYNLWGVGFYSPHMPAFAALTPADPPGLWPTGQIAPAEPLPDEGAADRDAHLRVRIGRRDAEPGPPDFPAPLQRVGGRRPCDGRLPGTPHSTGMRVAMADGSVRVFAPDTSPWVFWTACLPNR